MVNKIAGSWIFMPVSIQCLSAVWHFDLKLKILALWRLVRVKYGNVFQIVYAMSSWLLATCGW